VSEVSILLPIIIPLIAGLVILPVKQRFFSFSSLVALLGTLLTLVAAIVLYNQNIIYTLPWAGLGIEFNLRLYHFSGFIVLATAGFSFLFVLYCCSFMKEKSGANLFYFYMLVSVGMVNGAVLADNLVLMLFFWEGLLLTMFGMIALGGRDAFKTATKSFIIVGISDLCLMVGIGLTGYLSGTLTMSQINVPVGALGSAAFILMAIGAVAKAGSMPFHTWIPDAAVDAPLPFMAFMPASLEKLVGIYLLARISLDMFKLTAGSWLSVLLMTVGAITIVLAVMMALIQKDYKRLLSYHAISQVGYMILGIGTCLPVGIIGGIFHMINNALYKSCLFLTAGSVEKQTGTTNLYKLGGLWSKMPITFFCFFITAASISGVPPFNGFFSKEMVYDAAMKRGLIFYLAASVGSFLTAASFLKLGHAAFLGKINQDNEKTKEVSLTMLVPMIVIAAICVIFGLFHRFAVGTFIKPILGAEPLEETVNTMLVIITVIVLAAALVHHILAAKIMGGGVKASDHIRNAVVFKGLYDKAEKRFFDPYDIVIMIVNSFSALLFKADRLIDKVYDYLSVRTAYMLGNGIRSAHTGNYSVYVVWSLVGAVTVLVLLLR
jgi:NADH-quinone oxidoreductase subunit L